MRRRITIGFVLALLSAVPGAAQDFRKGVAAFSRGDYATALSEMRPLAARGNANAQNYLAVMLHNGDGAPRDDAEAVKWFRKAAEQGHAGAQTNLAIMYVIGGGVPRDYAKAALWFRRAADQGYARAQYNLAVMYVKGDGVPRDYAKARMWLQKAAAQGHAEAKKALRLVHENAQDRTPKSPPAPARGDFSVQLGAVRVEARAVKEAERLNRVHRSLLGRLKVVPVRADLGKRGIFYRLRAGPLNDLASAKSLCRKFSALQQDCIVVRP